MILLAMRLVGLRNAIRKTPGRYAVGVVFLGLIYWGVLTLTRRGVRFLDGVPSIGTIADAVAQRSLEVLFLMLMLGVTFTVLTSAVTTLYSSTDLPFLLGLPLPPAAVFRLKVAETYVSAALLPALFTFPVLVGLGLERAAPWGYYLISVAAVAALYAIPVAAGSLLALALMRIAPAGRVKETATAVSVLFAAALIFGLRALRPEQLVAMSPAEVEALIAQLASFDVGWSPAGWASGAVWQALDGRIAPEALVLALISFAFLSGVASLAAFAYREGWIRSLDSRPLRLDPQPRPPAPWERPLLALGKSGSIIVKDNRLLLRDPTQWSQLLVLLALAGVYLVSTASVTVGVQVYKDALGTMNLMFLSFLLAGVGVRTAYPIVSLEGEGFWMLKTGPISGRQIVLAKFMNSLPLMLLLGGGLGLAAAMVLDLSPILAVASPIAGLCAASVTTGLGIGLGAAFPRFDATNPAEIPLSPGGLLYMTLSFGFALLMTVILAYPAWQALQPGFGRPWAWTDPDGLLVLALLLTLTALATALPLFYGGYRLERFESGEG